MLLDYINSAVIKHQNLYMLSHRTSNWWKYNVLPWTR